MVPFCLISICVGVWFVTSALLEWEWFYEIMEISLIAAFFGDGAGRVVCLLFGVALVFVGIAGLFVK